MDYLATLEKAIELKKDLKYIILSRKFFHECQILFTQNVSDFGMWCLDSNQSVKVFIDDRFIDDAFSLLSLSEIDDISKNKPTIQDFINAANLQIDRLFNN